MPSIEIVLFREPQGVLSLTGGGGKTSLMFHLARLLANAGKRVLTTTTTKIFVPTAEQSATLIVAPDPQTILREASSCLQSTRHITAGVARLADTGKLEGFTPETIRIFLESALFDWILVEADGSARRPLKAPAGHEPVIPACTTVLVAVAGLEVIGQPLSENLVFRSELAGQLMGLAAGEPVSEAALVRLFAHPLGAFKGAPPQARRFIFLNQADNSERRESGTRIAAQLLRMAHPPAEALIVGQALERIRVHALHPLTVSA